MFFFACEEKLTGVLNSCRRAAAVAVPADGDDDDNDNDVFLQNARRAHKLVQHIRMCEHYGRQTPPGRLYSDKHVCVDLCDNGRVLHQPDTDGQRYPYTNTYVCTFICLLYNMLQWIVRGVLCNPFDVNCGLVSRDSEWEEI